MSALDLAVFIVDCTLDKSILEDRIIVTMALLSLFNFSKKSDKSPSFSLYLFVNPIGTPTPATAVGIGNTLSNLTAIVVVSIALSNFSIKELYFCTCLWYFVKIFCIESKFLTITSNSACGGHTLLSLFSTISFNVVIA